MTIPVMSSAASPAQMTVFIANLPSA
jgi:hypothetical protein